MEVVQPQTLSDHRHVELGRRLVLALERRQVADHVDDGRSPEMAEHDGIPVSKQFLVARNVSPNVVKKLLARIVYRSQHSVRVVTVESVSLSRLGLSPVMTAVCAPTCSAVNEGSALRRRVAAL